MILILLRFNIVKILTQFYECNGITRDIEPKQNVRVDAFAYALTDPNNKDSKVKVRVTGVISDLDFYENPIIINQET